MSQRNINDPMETLHALAKRVMEVTEDLGIELVRFVAIPSLTGPDCIGILFNLLPQSIKSSDEIEQDTLNAAFMDILGDITIEGDIDSGEITILGAEAARVEGETEEERAFREARNKKMLEEMRAALHDEDWDE